MRIAIVGGGIIGIATAHALLDEGHAVTLFDREGIGAGASRGNAGWIAHIDILPLASPKIWRSLPRWLADPLGPLTIRPAYLPALLPWLARFLAASSKGRIADGIAAISALNGLALPAWERRLAGLQLSNHLRPSGVLSVWSDLREQAGFLPVAERQRGLGIPVELLDQARLRALEPALGAAAAFGALYPTGAHVSEPMILLQALANAAIARGLAIVKAAVGGLAVRADGVGVRTEAAAALPFDRAVLAAGAWSRPLAAALGDRIPLDTERGYTITLTRGATGLTRPVCFEGQGFVVTPLATGDRIGGSVEFAGLQAAPNFRRVDAMLARLRRFIPGVVDDGGARWMGFRPSLPDSRPVIGPSAASGKVILAFGHGHHGLTQAAATAEIAAALIAGRPPPIDPAAYAARRFQQRF